MAAKGTGFLSKLSEFSKVSKIDEIAEAGNVISKGNEAINTLTKGSEVADTALNSTKKAWQRPDFYSLDIADTGCEGTGKGTTNINYKEVFFEQNPELRGEVVVHHGIEQQVLRRPETKELFTEEEIHSYDNLRGIPKEINSDVHLSKIRKEWNKFYKENPRPTKEQLLQKRLEIDQKFGDQFNPPIDK